MGRLGYTASEEEGEGRRTELEPADTWSSPEAVRTYVSGGLLLGGILVRLAGPDPLLQLPAEPLGPGGVLFLLAALVGGWNFFPKGVRAARTLSLDMNFLMTVAIVGGRASASTWRPGPSPSSSPWPSSWRTSPWTGRDAPSSRSWTCRRRRPRWWRTGGRRSAWWTG